MKYETFLYTRDLTNDYRWHKRPEILSGGFYKFFTPLVELREAMEDEEINWSKIFFFTKYEGVNVACRILSEVGEDYVGRPIYSLEGVVSEDMMKRSNYRIPDLVNYFSRNLEGYALTESNGYALPGSIDIEDEINPLMRLYLNRDGNESEIRNNPVFKSLVEDIRFGRTGYSFVIGPDAERVFNVMNSLSAGRYLNCDKFYDIRMENENLKEAAASNTDIDTNANTNTNTDKDYAFINTEMSMSENDVKSVTLYLHFNNEGKNTGSYEWILKNNINNKCYRSKKRKFESHLPFNKLCEDAKRIKDHYALLGYEVN